MYSFFFFSFYILQPQSVDMYKKDKSCMKSFPQLKFSFVHLGPVTVLIRILWLALATYAFHECEHVLSHLLPAFLIHLHARRRRTSTAAGAPLRLDCLRRYVVAHEEARKPD